MRRKLVLPTRLSPIFPFNLLNDAFGVTQVRLRDYVIGSLVGMLPGTMVYVYLGSLVTSVSELAAGRASGGLAEVCYFAGPAATGVLTAEERVDIYAQVDWARLYDVVREDVSRVAALLGAEVLAETVCAYLADHPSRHPSVRHVGEDFADFLVLGEGARHPFLADLARLEWARLAAFDAPDAPLLDLDALRSIPGDAWPGLAFRVAPCVQRLHASWPVHEIWARGDGASGDGVASSETYLRIWRNDATVYQAPMDAIERTALAAVSDGKAFAEVCSALEAVCGPQDAAREAAGLVLRWVEDGILARS